MLSSAMWTRWAHGWQIFLTSDFKVGPEFKLRVGDYRVLYEFDVKQGRIYLHYVGHRREIYKRPN